MSTIINVLQSIGVALFGGSYTPPGGTATTVTGAIPTFWNWLTQSDVLPYFMIGVAVALLLLAVRVVKGIFWGV